MAVRQHQPRLLLLGIGLIAYSMVTGPNIAEGASTSDSPPPDPGVIQMASDYHISLSESADRIERQLRFEDIAAEMEKINPKEYVGARITNKGANELTIGISDDDTHTSLQAVPDDLRPFVTILSSSGPSIAQQETFRASVDSYLRGRDQGWVTAYDWASRTLEVEIFDDQPSVVIEQAISEISLLLPADVSLKTSRGARPTATSMWTDAPGCTTVRPQQCNSSSALRGGMQMKNTTTGSSCTAGFVVRSRSNSLPFILTAGHCFPPSSGTQSYDSVYGPPSSQVLTTIGDTHHSIVGGHADYGIIYMPSTAAVNGRVLVLSSSGPGYPTSYNDWYGINSTPYGGSAAIIGSYVCKSGSTEGTACGELTQVNWTDGRGINGQGLVFFDKNEAGYYERGVCAGDSGGPVFVNHKAYGIVASYGPPATQEPGECTGAFGYTGISYALDELNVNLANS